MSLREDAHVARKRANDLAAEAAQAAAEAASLEAQATAEEEGVEYVAPDPLAGTWEGHVQGEAPAVEETVVVDESDEAAE